MAKISSTIQLSDEEVDQLMSHTGRCRIATIGPGEDINLTPMTFGWADGKAYIFARGQKIANLRRKDTATLLVDIGDAWRELKGVMMHGKATVLEDAAAEREDDGLAAARHNIADKHNLDKPHDATASGNSRRWIVFTPTRIITWDNSKL